MTIRLLSLFLVLTMGMIVGCESTPTIKEVGQDSSITSERLDIQNFNRAVTELTNKMLTQPRVGEEMARISQQSGGKRPYVKISRIKNDTGLKINMLDYLVTPMEEVFVNSGKLDFVSEDRQANELAAGHDMLRGTQPRLPDMVIEGTVNRLNTNDGRTNQNTYVFRLRLVDAATNTVFFVGNTEPIIKQANRSSMGF